MFSSHFRDSYSYDTLCKVDRGVGLVIWKPEISCAEVTTYHNELGQHESDVQLFVTSRERGPHKPTGRCQGGQHRNENDIDIDE